MQCLAVMAGIDGTGDLVEHGSGGEQFGRAVGKHARDQLVLAQRLAVDDACLRERGHLVDEALRRTDATRRHHHPLESEPVLGERHRTALGAHQVLDAAPERR